MDTVEEEVEDKSPVLLGQVVVHVKEEPVEGVFEDCPYDVTCKEAGHGGKEGELGRSGDGGGRPCKEGTGGDGTGQSAWFDLNLGRTLTSHRIASRIEQRGKR
jgi:hypothetical protein